MNVNENNFSFKDYEQFKNSPATEQKMSGDDLNYLAMLGFEKAGITQRDVTEINRRVNAKTFVQTYLGSILAGGIVVLIFISAFFMLMNKNETPGNKNIAATSVSEEPSVVILKNAVPATSVVDSTPKEIKNSFWQKEHFSSKNSVQDVEVSVAAPLPDPEDMEVNRITSVSENKNDEIKFEQIPNAPVVYINGFKVTNYSIYYFRADKKFELLNGGRDAEFIDNADYVTKRKEYKSGYKKVTAVDMLKDALESFGDQQYAECVGSFDILLKVNPKDVNALFYSAMSMYFIGKNPKSIEYFDKILESNNNIFHQEAEFYKAMALAHNGQNFESATLLKKIAEDNGFYAERAKEILK
jgi:tetratricopeptide (TPR) repeat protein